VLLVPRWKEYLQARIALARLEEGQWLPVRWAMRDDGAPWRDFLLRRRGGEGVTLVKGQIFLRADETGKWMIEDFQWQQIVESEGFVPEGTRLGSPLIP